MIPVALVAAAIFVAAPWVSTENRARYAADIAAVAPDLETARALVATAAVESGFRGTIERCECREGECDRGLAVSLYQLHRYHFHGHTAEEICSSNRLATELTARVLSGLAKRVGGMGEALRVYVGVEVRRDDPRITKRIAIFLVLTGGSR
jgi:hypothetical protein